MALGKRLLRVVLFAIIFAASSLPYTAHAADMDISVTMRPTGTDGELEATVSLANNPGISVYNLALAFDNSKLTPVSITQGGAPAGGMVFASNLADATTDAQKAYLSRVTAVWGSAEDRYENGILFSVVFRENSSADENPAVTLVVNRIISNETDISSPSPNDANNADPAADDGSFIGNAEHPDDGSRQPNAYDNISRGAQSFDRVPQTDVPDITWAVAGLIISLIALIALFACTVRLLHKRGNDGRI